MDKLTELKSKIEEFQAKSAFASDMKSFMAIVLKVIKDTKDNVKDISDENQAKLDRVLAYLEQKHANLLENVDVKIKNISQETTKLTNNVLEENKLIKKDVSNIKDTLETLKFLIDDISFDQEFENLAKKITELEKKIPKIEVETGETIVDKINEGDKLIKAEKVEGSDKFITQSNLDRAISILDQRTSYLIQKQTTTTTTGGSGTVTSVAMTVPTGLAISGSPITTSGTLALTLDTGYVIPLQSTLDAKLDGNGTATYVPFYADTNTLESDSHFYYNKTTDVLHVHGLAGDATDGLLIESEGGTDIAIMGAANTANVTWYGSHNFSTATQDTIAGFTGAGKTLGSLSTATYPSLTELSYVKGVTSAIQTQLNAKGVGDMVLASAQSVTGLKTFDTTKLAVKGSSTGTTAIASANAGASNYTATLQAATGTLAYLTDITGTNSNTNTGDQTITNSSDATSHTVTLSASGGSVQFIEGTNITLTTGGTGSAGTLTIAASGGGLSWGSSISGTTADGVTLTLSNTTDDGASALKLIAGNTQANQSVLANLQLGTSGNVQGLLIQGTGSGTLGAVGTGANHLTLWGNTASNDNIVFAVGNEVAFTEHFNIRAHGGMTSDWTTLPANPSFGYGWNITVGDAGGNNRSGIRQTWGNTQTNTGGMAYLTQVGTTGKVNGLVVRGTFGGLGTDYTAEGTGVYVHGNTASQNKQAFATGNEAVATTTWYVSTAGQTVQNLTLATVSANNVTLPNSVTSAKAGYEVTLGNTQANSPYGFLANVGTSAKVTGVMVKGTFGTATTGLTSAFTAWGNTANQATRAFTTGNGVSYTETAFINTDGNATLATLTTTGNIELGHATDTTIARVSAGVASIEGARIITSTGTTSGTILKNNGTTFVASTETYAAPGASGNVMTSDGTNWTSAAPAASGSSTAVDSTQSVYNNYELEFSGSGATPTGDTWNVNGTLNAATRWNGKLFRVTFGTNTDITQFLPGNIGSSSAFLQFGNGKDIIVSWNAKYSSVTGQVGIGIADDTSVFYAVSTSAGKMVFTYDGTTLNAVNGEAGSNTTTNVSSGITATNWNAYKIVYTYGTNVKFYINNTLVATHTTNLPTSSSNARFGIGAATTGKTAEIANVVISVEK